VATWKCAASRSLPLNTERAWDGDAAKGRIFEWAGGEDDSVGSKARRAFLAYDNDAADQRGAYKLPFADIVDGQLTALASGVRAAASRLPQTDISEEAKSTASDVIDSYMSKIHDEQATDEERAAGGIMLARTPIGGDRAQRQPSKQDELPEELLAQIHDRSVLQKALPYLNSAWGSTDRVDTYFTRMLPTTLQNFADDSTAGVSMQNSHRTNELALGRTYNGTYTAKRSNAPGRTVMDFYIPPGVRLTDVASDDVIEGIKWGTIKDVSVGFYGGEVRCSMCSKPMLRNLFALIFFGGDDDREQIDPESPCMHLPGLDYAVRDKEGKKTGERAMAIGEIDGAHLAELSFVFDGATPQAQIKGRQAPVMEKASRMLEAGVLGRREAMALEQQWRSRGMRLPHLEELTHRSYPAAVAEPPEPTTEPKEAASMQDTERAAAGAATTTTTPPPGGVSAETGGSGGGATPANPSPPPVAPDHVPALRSVMVRAGLAPEGFDGEISVRLAELGSEMQALREWADIGRAAREQLVERCKRSGVRAFGRSWSEAAYGPVLARGTYQELSDLEAHFEKIGDERFPSGRKTEGDIEPVPAERTQVSVPDRAFRA
jgi:hypothetical protein